MDHRSAVCSVRDQWCGTPWDGRIVSGAHQLGHCTRHCIRRSSSIQKVNLRV